jgi:RNA polymerase sigma factor (sigma-70 family)
MAPQPNPDEVQRRRAQLLDTLMRSNKRQLRWQARRFTPNDQDADDAIEDGCVAFLRNFDGTSEDHAVRWMMVTVKHAALAITRRNSVLSQGNDAPHAPDESWDPVVRDPRGSTEDQAEVREWVAARMDLLAELKPDERTAVSLFAAGYSYREIGERHGWSKRKVERFIAEGRARLRELLTLKGERS